MTKSEREIKIDENVWCTKLDHLPICLETNFKTVDITFKYRSHSTGLLKDATTSLH